MVARIVFGREIEKAIRYNEDKVTKGKADFLEAAGIGWGAENLKLRDKIAWFREITSRRKMVRTNAVHISLNFHPDEKIPKNTLQEIASRYMEKIGFGEQPYLLYKHKDAGHPHIHIVTTNIRYDGTPIDTRWIWKLKSEPARMELEEEFGLIKASGRDIGQALNMHPLDVDTLQYGGQETKSAISNVVRKVISAYRFSNLEEFRQVLLQFNVTVDEGKEGTRLHQTGGLLYSMIDQAGQKIGNQIKASSIYTKPTLSMLQELYSPKTSQKQKYKGRLIRIVDDALLAGGSKEHFMGQLKALGVKVVFHTNDNNFTYGITFIDNLTKCVFKGSDLKKGYSAQAIIRKITEAADPAYQYNFLFTNHILQRTNFLQPAATLRSWKKAGVKMLRHVDQSGKVSYCFGHSKTPEKCYVLIPPHVSNWIEAVRTHQEQLSSRSRYRSLLNNNSFLDAAEKYFGIGINDISQAHTELLDPIHTGNVLPHDLLREAKRKRKRKKRQL